MIGKTEVEDQFDALLERVMSAVIDAKGDPKHLSRALKEVAFDDRALAVIRALLVTAEAIAVNFEPPVNRTGDDELARRMARHLAELADDHERNRTPKGTLKMCDLPF